MDRDKTRLMAIRKSALTLTAIILVLASFVGSTVAYLVDASGSISSLLVLNPYVTVEILPEEPARLLAYLRVHNTSDEVAYVRMKFDVIWSNGDETNPPVEDSDYFISGRYHWTKAADDFWYCIDPIPAGGRSIYITLRSLNSNKMVKFNVTSYDAVIADANLVTKVFSSGVSDVEPDGTLVIITE